MTISKIRQAIRQPSKTPGRNFFHRIRVGAIIAVVIFLMGALSRTASDPIDVWLDDQRWWNDATQQTPFYAVHVTKQELTPRGVSLMGDMIKRRCEWTGLSAYVKVNGLLYRTIVDVSGETKIRPPGNRSPTPEPQAWGDWLVLWPIKRDRPTSWQIWAEHQCPDESTTRVNLFAKGPWK